MLFESKYWKLYEYDGASFKTCISVKLEILLVASNSSIKALLSAETILDKSLLFNNSFWEIKIFKLIFDFNSIKYLSEKCCFNSYFLAISNETSLLAE